jgi:hypothetical protein
MASESEVIETTVGKVAAELAKRGHHRNRPSRMVVSQPYSGRYISSIERRRGSSRMRPLLAAPQGL